MSSPEALQPEPDGKAVRLTVRVQPNARRAAPAGSWNGLLKLAVPAPPEGGRANEAALALVAELFGLRPSAVTLVRGHSARTKVLRLALAPAAARARLTELLSTR
ncbi:MAG TPA: DUF167 domain-containing protein [Planctomycetota bacterium]